MKTCVWCVCVYVCSGSVVESGLWWCALSARCVAREKSSGERYSHLAVFLATTTVPVMTTVLKVVFRGTTHEIPLQSMADTTLGNLRERIAELTGVAPRDQKLLGLTAAGRPAPPDGTPLATLGLNPRKALMLLGMTRAEHEAARSQEAAARLETEEFRSNLAALEEEEDRVEQERRQRQAAIGAREAALLQQRRAQEMCVSLAVSIGGPLFDTRAHTNTGNAARRLQARTTRLGYGA